MNFKQKKNQTGLKSFKVKLILKHNTYQLEDQRTFKTSFGKFTQQW